MERGEVGSDVIPASEIWRLGQMEHSESLPDLSLYLIKQWVHFTYLS